MPERASKALFAWVLFLTMVAHAFAKPASLVSLTVTLLPAPQLRPG